MVKEQFGHETEVLAVLLMVLPVHFKHRNLMLSVDFSTRWMQSQASDLKHNTIICTCTCTWLIAYYMYM